MADRLEEVWEDLKTQRDELGTTYKNIRSRLKEDS